METCMGLSKEQFYTGVYAKLKPEGTRAEFEQKWAQFQRDKHEHEALASVPGARAN